MLRNIQGWLLLTALLLLPGCTTLDTIDRLGRDRAAKITLAPQQEGYALVYLFRPHHGFASSVWPEVYLNDTAVVELKNGRFTYVYVRPGFYRVVAKKAQWYASGWGETTELSVNAGNTYFLSLRVLDETTEDGARRVWDILPLAPAKAELNRLDYVEPSINQL